MIKLISFILSISLLVNYVAGNDNEPSYNRLKAILITEFFRALTDKQYQMALDKLDRLRELYPESSVFNSLGREVKENMAIVEVKEFLDHGEYVHALDLLERSTTTDKPGTQRLAAEREKIKNLIRIRKYVKQMPSPTVEKAKNAFSHLPVPKAINGNVDFYSNWYKNQKHNLEKLIFDEKKRLLGEILDEIDISICTSSGLYPLAISQLLLFLSDNVTPGILYNKVIRIFNMELQAEEIFDFFDNETVFRKDPSSSVPAGNQHRLQELAFCVAYLNGPEELKLKLAPKLKDKTFSTLTGLLLQTENNFRNGEAFIGFMNFTRLFRLFRRFDGERIYQAIEDEYLSDKLIPHVPCISSVFFHLYYLKDFQ